MTRLFIVTAILGFAIYSARAGGRLIKDAPSVIRLPFGQEVKVLSITRTELHESNEPVLAVQYVTAIAISDVEHLFREAEQVFDAIRPLAEREKVRAAVVTANEPLFHMSSGAGWCWKQRPDGSWGPPDENDEARVPK